MAAICPENLILFRYFMCYHAANKEHIMIEILPITVDHVIGIRILGKISKEDIERIIQTVRASMDQTDKKLGVYVELVDWGGISLDALWEDLKFGLPNLSRFAKKAVVTDKTWVATLAEIGRFFPGIEVRCYPFEEKDLALQWIQE